MENNEVKEIIRMDVNELIPHPKNKEIYGENEDVSDLVEMIRKSNVVHTLVATSKKVILAGHRRALACKDLNIEKVDVEIRDFETAEEEVEFIILNNAQREKSNEQKARECMKMKDLEEPLAELRRKRNQPDEVTISTPQETGKVRDILAKKCGYTSGIQADRAMQIVKKIDELQKNGRNEDADLIRSVLNKEALSSAHSFIKKFDTLDLSVENREKLKSGKMKVAKLLKNPESKLEKIKKQYATFSKKMETDIENLLQNDYFKNEEDVSDKIKSELKAVWEKMKNFEELLNSMVEEADMENTINIQKGSEVG